MRPGWIQGWIQGSQGARHSSGAADAGSQAGLHLSEPAAGGQDAEAGNGETCAWGAAKPPPHLLLSRAQLLHLGLQPGDGSHVLHTRTARAQATQDGF